MRYNLILRLVGANAIRPTDRANAIRGRMPFAGECHSPLQTSFNMKTAVNCRGECLQAPVDWGRMPASPYKPHYKEGNCCIGWVDSYHKPNLFFCQSGFFVPI
jgi:hypothetical protein